MPYNHISSSQRERSMEASNARLEDMARNLLDKSPPLRKEIRLNMDVEALREKEFVGLEFNRNMREPNQKRWEVIQNLQNELKRNVGRSTTVIEEEEAKMNKLVEDITRDRDATKHLSSRIIHLRQLLEELKGYSEDLQDSISLYQHFATYMHEVANKGTFNREIDVIRRYTNLKSFKTEMIQNNEANRTELKELSYAHRKLSRAFESNTLNMGTEIVQLSQKYKDLADKNQNDEENLDYIIKKASGTSRSLFNFNMGLTSVTDCIKKYKYIQIPEEETLEPLEMVNFIEHWFLRIISVVNHVTSASKKKPRRLAGRFQQKTDTQSNPSSSSSKTDTAMAKGKKMSAGKQSSSGRHSSSGRPNSSGRLSSGTKAARKKSVSAVSSGTKAAGRKSVSALKLPRIKSASKTNSKEISFKV